MSKTKIKSLIALSVAVFIIAAAVLVFGTLFASANDDAFATELRNSLR